jgi:hypothetical protein
MISDWLLTYVDKWTEVPMRTYLEWSKNFRPLSRRFIGVLTPVVFSLASDITPPVSWIELRIKGANVQETVSIHWQKSGRHFAPCAPF